MEWHVRGVASNEGRGSRVYHGVEDVVAEDLGDAEGDPEREEQPACPAPLLQRRLPPLRRHVGELPDVGEAAAGEAQAAAQQQRAHPRAEHPQHHPRQGHRLADAPRHHQLRDLFVCCRCSNTKKKLTYTQKQNVMSFFS